MIFVWMLFAGLAIGLGFAIRIILGLLVWGSADSYEWARQDQIAKEKRSWLRSLSPEDREAFLLHEKRKKLYIKLREKFARKLNQRILKEFIRIKPPLKDREVLRQRIANAMWLEWDMSSWDDINMAPDCPWGLEPSWGQCPDESKYLPPKPLWTPPEWRRKEVER